jgi:ubiquinone/menaquinone biosynthesis C-methylase UbiE
VRASRVVFAHKDAEHLPYAPHSFDVVMSTFGIAFIPLPETVAREAALRVLRPGGRLALAHWGTVGAAAAEDEALGSCHRCASRLVPR